jgi:hypothetical protein
MIRGSYRPVAARRDGIGGLGPVDELLTQVRTGNAKRDELLGRYYALVLHQSDGNFSEAGRRLDTDWKTVRDRYDRDFYDRLKHQSDPCLQ